MMVEYFSYKTEFQDRGAGHVHGVLWVKLYKIEKLCRLPDNSLVLLTKDEKREKREKKENCYWGNNLPMSSALKQRPFTQIMDLTEISVAVETPKMFLSNSAWLSLPPP